MFDLHVPRVTGHQILVDLRADLARAFSTGAVAPSPRDAIDRLRRIHGEVSDLSLIGAAPAVREAVAALDRAVAGSATLSHYPERVLFTAPHSHWAADVRITVVYDRERDCLFIGDNPIDEEGLYAPVSFVLIAGRAIPYEFFSLAHWPLDSDPISDFFGLLPSATQSIDTLRDGLGLSYDYRGSVFAGKTAPPTVESDFDKHVGIIEPSARYERLHGRKDFERTEPVAWPALAAKRIAELGDPEADIFRRLSASLASCESEEERERLAERYAALLAQQ